MCFALFFVNAYINDTMGTNWYHLFCINESFYLMTESTFFDLTTSKLFSLAQTTDLTDGLEPSFDKVLVLETMLDEQLPRTAEDRDDTRIFISFTNLRGNNQFFKVNHHTRMFSHIDIDDFLTGYAKALETDDDGRKIEGAVELDHHLVLRSALVYGAMRTIGLEEVKRESEKTLAQEVLCSIVMTLYNDPLDVFIQLQETKTDDGSASFVAIPAMWRTKSRAALPTEEIEEPTVN